MGSTVTPSKSDMESDWKTASDLDPPQNLAWLFTRHPSPKSTIVTNQSNNSTPSTKDDLHDHFLCCGHAMEWIPSFVVDAKRCPLCNAPISLIQNGNEHPFVTFQFGKQIYRISLPSSSSPLDSPTTWVSKVWTTWMSMTDKDTTSMTHANVFAQDQIQKSLQLKDGFKILFQGKVLFPFKSKSKSNDKKNNESVQKQSSQELSKELIRISNLSIMKPDDVSSKTKHPMLLVMGTLEGRGLSPRPKDHDNNISQKHPWTIKQWLQLPFAICYYGIHSIVLFSKSFLVPFFPSFASSIENYHGTTGNNRQHED